MLILMDWEGSRLGQGEIEPSAGQPTHFSAAEVEEQIEKIEACEFCVDMRGRRTFYNSFFDESVRRRARRPGSGSPVMRNASTAP